MNYRIRAALALVLAAPLAAAAFGGWAVVTLDDVPTHLVAGHRTPITFAVRQHGVRLIPQLKPSVELRSGSNITTVAATPTEREGYYEAIVVAPSPGTWTMTVQSGFGNSRTTLLPLTVLAPNEAPPRAVAESDRGHQLFYGKGCTTCHVRGSEGNTDFTVGPQLTGRRYAAEVVGKFLDDPESSPLSKANVNQYARMPRLGLSAREISALVAFLNTSEVAARN